MSGRSASSGTGPRMTSRNQSLPTKRTPGQQRAVFAGAIAGAGVGGLVGLGVVSGVIPVLGPVIAGGTLAAILANAAGGAAVGSVFGGLAGNDLPHEEVNYYQGEFEARRTIVTISAGGRYDEADSILRRHGAYDMNSRDSRPAVKTAPSETTPRNTTTMGATTAPYPQTPLETQRSVQSGHEGSRQITYEPRPRDRSGPQVPQREASRPDKTATDYQTFARPAVLSGWSSSLPGHRATRSTASDKRYAYTHSLFMT